MFTVAMIVVTLISTFTAGSAVGFAVQGQVAKQKADLLEQQINELESAIEILDENIQPMSFLNQISNLAGTLLPKYLSRGRSGANLIHGLFAM